MTTNRHIALVVAFAGAMCALALPGACRADWKGGPEWTVAGPSALTVTATSQTEAWNTTDHLVAPWQIASDVSITGGDGGNGAARVLLGDRVGDTQIIVTVSRLPSQNVIMFAVEYNDGNWHDALRSGWIPGRDTNFALAISRSGASVDVRVYGDQGLNFDEVSAPLPASILDAVNCIGLAGIDAKLQYSNIHVAGPIPDKGHYLSQAQTAMDSLIDHYWIGGPDTGYIVPTYSGYPVAGQADARGSMWERELMVFSMDTLYRATGDPILKRRLQAQWNWIKTKFAPDELQAAGTSIHAGSDDTGWDALAYLTFYRDTRDPVALDMAKGLLDSGYKRWLSADLGGGLWYANDHRDKSLYGISIVYGSLQVFEATHDQAFYDRALACYNWMESHLLRPDNIYWCDIDANGPLGKERPADIHEGGSISFLAGNMGMAILHAWFYKHTKDQVYLDRAKRTVDAIASVYAREGGYFDDRDAWTNGTFFGDWADHVLTLPGIDPRQKQIVFDTADSIETHDRTREGFYGGCWQGPVDGPKSRWSTHGSRAQQIMTSSSSSIVIMAAALAASK